MKVMDCSMYVIEATFDDVSCNYGGLCLRYDYRFDFNADLLVVVHGAADYKLNAYDRRKGLAPIIIENYGHGPQENVCGIKLIDDKVMIGSHNAVIKVLTLSSDGNKAKIKYTKSASIFWLGLLSALPPVRPRLGHCADEERQVMVWSVHG